MCILYSIIPIFHTQETQPLHCVMEQKDRMTLLHNRVLLVKHMACTPNFLDNLTKDKILTPFHLEEISVVPNKFVQNGLFLNLITKRGPEAFSSFTSAARADHQECVVGILMHTTTPPVIIM